MFCNLGKSERALTSWLGKQERSKEQQSVAVGTPYTQLHNHKRDDTLIERSRIIQQGKRIGNIICAFLHFADISSDSLFPNFSLPHVPWDEVPKGVIFLSETEKICMIVIFEYLLISLMMGNMLILFLANSLMRKLLKWSCLYCKYEATARRWLTQF